MSTYTDVKARCARIVTRLEAIATDPSATPADPRDLFVSEFVTDRSNLLVSGSAIGGSITPVSDG
jgi:hypothetical protein